MPPITPVQLATGPTPNLSWSELACHDGTPYPKQWRVSRAVPLAAELEAIREACGNRPIRILSAYRTLEHNRKVGGARLSQHVEGRALDLATPDGISLEEFWLIVNRVARERGVIHGLGLYPSFVHIDIRPGRVVKWAGTRALADLVAEAR
jgi:hypothetical protein